MTSEVKPNVCIVESLGLLDEDSYREGEVISRTLQMSGKRCKYIYVRDERELTRAAEEFGESDQYRYLHISCHGGKKHFSTTLDDIPLQAFANIVGPNLSGRRLFVSSCLAVNSAFARHLLLNSECLSVVGPVGKIRFDDAAIFWSSFYHLMFKQNRQSMHSDNIRTAVDRCAKLVAQRFRFFRRRDGKLKQEILG